MPDWSYMTVFRPVLFRLPPERARDLSLWAMGTLSRMPGGSFVIDLLGHMRPDERLARTFLGITFPSPLGLGPALDGNASAPAALARFGVGFIEIGPITAEPVTASPCVTRSDEDGAIGYPAPHPNLGVEEIKRRLVRCPRMAVPLILRVGSRPGPTPQASTDDVCRTMEDLRPFVSLVSLATLPQAMAEDWPMNAWRDHVAAVVQKASPLPVLLVIATEFDANAGDDHVRAGLAAGIRGVIVDGSIRSEKPGRFHGAPARDAALAQVKQLRERYNRDLLVVAGGGIHEPQHSRRFLEAGADLIQTDTGLIFSGPGLPKRINESILANASFSRPPPERAPEMRWFWTLLLGSGLLFGGFLALIFASTRIVLPYDESFVQLQRDQFGTINPRLLAFMAHDRVSVAGTLFAVGVFYVTLSLFAIRRGSHWASIAVLTSGFTGFASFFLFLGFGYFDPFHAFITAVMFQFLLLALRSRIGPPLVPAHHTCRNDRAWRLSLWGQLLFIAHGFSLLSAGSIISAIGSTSVFVKEDLMFMNTTAEALRAANPRLVPLVAHDRASFGGMLIVSGLVVLLSALWGFRRGERWLWWMYLLGLGPAYACALAVHYAVGYTHTGHLLPAFAGALLLLVALILTRPFLCDVPLNPGGAPES
jgi:dihydroorotate dehydrogenase